MRNRLLILSLLLAAIVFGVSAGERFSYVFKRGPRSVVRIGSSFEHYKGIEKRVGGEYIWLYRGGRGYLIRDAAVLASARAAFARVDALEPKMRELEEKLRPIEEKYEELEERADEFRDRNRPDQALEAQLRAMEPELKRAERAAEAVEEEMDRREEIAEAKFEEIVIRAIRDGKAERLD